MTKILPTDSPDAASNAQTELRPVDPEEFRRSGYALIDWIAEYMNKVESLPVLSSAKPGEILDKLPQHPPATAETFEAMMRDVEAILLPGVTHWQSPNFFAYFPANSSPPAVLGELLSAGLGVQGMLWSTSPACTELETRVMDWLVEMLALPDRFASMSKGGGVIQDSASSATLCALLAAREQATDGRSNEEGCDGKLVAYASDQAHSSIEKACLISGIGRRNLVKIPVDDKFALRPGALLEAINKDRAAGRQPFFVSACVGSTSSLATDPIREVAAICREQSLWLHVDAAMAGTAAICPEFRHINDGIDGADSYTFNPHKWMFTNFDCNAFFVADRRALINALTILPDYLRNEATDSGAVVDYRDWQIPLGRRFRALKLWFVIRHYGVEGLRHLIRRHVQLANIFAGWVEADDDFELVTAASLNLICFRHKKGNAFNERLLGEINASGELYLSHTVLDGIYTLRFCVGQTQTEARHVENAWRRIRESAAGLSGS